MIADAIAAIGLAPPPAANVYNDNNESIGSINDLLTDRNGSIKAVVLGVGGFLGMGAHLVAVPYDKMKFVNEPIAYTGVAGSPNGAGNRPASPVTTGAASGTTTGARPDRPRHRRPIRGTRTSPCSMPPRISSRRCPSSNIRPSRSNRSPV
jgi:hypothetical protein